LEARSRRLLEIAVKKASGLEIESVDAKTTYRRRARLVTVIFFTTMCIDCDVR